MPDPVMAPSGRDVEREIAACVAGQVLHPADAAAFTDAAVRHQMAPVLVQAGIAARLPPGHAATLTGEARRYAALTVLRERELARVLEGIAGAGLPALVIKGAHLANTCYAASHLRVRHDSDILLRPADREKAVRVLSGLGYRWQPVQTGDVVLGQMMFDRAGAVGGALDVHWRMAAPRVAAALFDFDDLRGRAVPVPRLGPHAHAPCAADALAIACVHQVAHHPEERLLMWMYDVHLLLGSFDDREAAAFVERAAARRMTRLCRAVIGGAAEMFPSARALDVVRELERVAGAGEAEPSASLLERRRRIDGLFADLAEIPEWRDRARLLAAHLFPPAGYMRLTYAPGSRASLPSLYLRRMAAGARRWLRRPAVTVASAAGPGVKSAD